MKAKLVTFGELEIDGESYTHDIVINAGKITKRDKKPSKKLRDEYGHTPLSIDEDIPWGGDKLLIGTGAHGNLPVTKDIEKEAEKRDIELVCVPTEKACEMLEKMNKKDVFAVLHCTC